MNSDFPYKPKTWVVILYFVMLFSALLLFGGRVSEKLQPTFLLMLLPDYISHISNFTISLEVYLMTGFLVILRTNILQNITYFGLAIILANFIYEIFLTYLNTPDILDAWYGVAGVASTQLFLYFVKHFGIKNGK